MTKSQRIELRVTEAEKKSWAEKAGGQRRVSEWLRSLANAAPSPEEQPKIVSAAGTPLPVVKARDVLRNVPKTCPRAHHHRPGVYCGTCGKVN